MRRLLSPAVEVEETNRDAPETALIGDEIRAVAGAVAKRRAEFATVRDCAHRALSRLGHRDTAVLTGSNREPIWPAGIVGSMTHCEGYRAAAVARADQIATLGIDAEVNAPLPDGVDSLVTIGDEPAMLTALANDESGGEQIAWDRVLFSAKESIYKAWYPVTRTWLDFTDCELILSRDGTFVGQFRVAGPVIDDHQLTEFAGCWGTIGSHVVTAVEIPHR